MMKWVLFGCLFTFMLPMAPSLQLSPAFLGATLQPQLRVRLPLVLAPSRASGVRCLAGDGGQLSPRRSVLVTGANKGQGYSLCERILEEHDDTHVFLCSRDLARGEEAGASLSLKFAADRIDVVQLDVTQPDSVDAAQRQVCAQLRGAQMYGVVSNAGIMWDASLSDLLDVCASGPRLVLDAFIPLLSDKGRVVVVSSGLGPLMHGYASQQRQAALTSRECSWQTLEEMMNECKAIPKGVAAAEAFAAIGFSGGPFAEAAPDFHMYGLAKMFADSYMLSLAAAHPSLHINSCDPGLVFTDLIRPIPRYQGKTFEESGAKSPAQGVEAAMRLLFGGAEEGVVLEESGKFYAMSKDQTDLLHSCIAVQPRST